MKCKLCGSEMLVDSVIETADNEEIFKYKCTNPKCSNYGYKDEKGTDAMSKNI